MRSILSVLICFILFSNCAERPLLDKSGQPNILFLFADDLTYRAVNALGNDEIQTPNIDRLVKTGTTFTHVYNMGGWNGAICAASRAMIISGRSMWNANEYRQNWINKDSVALSHTWGKLMEAQGYNTYMSGKWHVDAPANQVFQEARNIRPGMPGDAWNNYHKPGGTRGYNLDKKTEMLGSNKWKNKPHGYFRPTSESDDSWSASDESLGGFWQGGKHWSEVLRDDGISFIENAKSKDDPFFMYLAFNAPHDPRQAPASYLEKYKVDDIALPKSFLEEYPYKDAIGNDVLLRDEALAPFPRTPYAVKKHIQEYYAIISHLDDQIGKILEALEKSGKLENTVIFFSADHGLSVGRHGLIGKQSMFDHSMRVPLVVSGKNIPKGEKINTPIYLQDIMPTVLELGGVEQPDFVEFNSLNGFFDGSNSSSVRPSIYGAYMDLQRMIKKDNYKLIVYPKIKKILLFDLDKDPEEMNDLAEKENHQEKIKDLFKELQSLQIDMNDPFPLISEDYKELF